MFSGQVHEYSPSAVSHFALTPHGRVKHTSINVNKIRQELDIR